MAKPTRNHLYTDQQRPRDEDEEPVDPEHASIPQERFARRPPSPEDDYFRQQAWNKPRAATEAAGEEQAPLAHGLNAKADSAPIEWTNQEDKQPRGGTLWDRVTRVFLKHFNTHWRP